MRPGVVGIGACNAWGAGAAWAMLVHVAVRSSSDACYLACAFFFPRQGRRRFGGLVGVEKDSPEAKSRSLRQCSLPLCGAPLHLWLNLPALALRGTAWRAATFTAPACAGTWQSAGYVMEATAWSSRPWEVFQTGFHRTIATPRRAGSSYGRSRSLVGLGVFVAVLSTQLLRDLDQPSMVLAEPWLCHSQRCSSSRALLLLPQNFPPCP